MRRIKSGQSIFKKVAVSERKMLLREIAHDKLQLTVKGAGQEDVFHLVAFQTEKDEVLQCRHTTDSKQVTEGQKVTVNFPFRTERYFFQTDLSFDEGVPSLRIAVDLFQLQRRASARIEIPEEIEAEFSIVWREGASMFVKSRVKDISAGGLKIEIPAGSAGFKVNDKIKGVLHIGQRRPLELEAEIRFSRTNGSDPQAAQIVGLQFRNLAYMMEHRLLSLVMDVQREIYLKFAGK